MADKISVRALSDLIGAIYDCALDPSRWEDTLTRIKDELHSETAVLHLNDLSCDRVLMQKNVGIEPSWLEKQAKYVSEIHRLLPKLPIPDEPHVLSRHIPRSIVEASQFVQDWLKPQGIIDVMQLFLVHTPTHYSGLGIGWHQRHGIATDHEIEFARLLSPHLRRAVTIGNILDFRVIERTRITEALDALRCGVVLTDKQGVILHANCSAQHMLANGDLIKELRGVLSVNAPSAAKELRTAIKRAACDEADLGETGLAVRVTDPDEPPSFAHVLPISRGNLRTRLQPNAMAAVFVETLPNEQYMANTMAKTFGLTPTEIRVLTSLLAGRTLAETAEDLHVAMTTVKTHLKSIFSKTGVNRQAELMRLTLRVVSPLGTSAAPAH
jgi:DNA-binding CsgD family transcriptional regulator